MTTTLEQAGVMNTPAPTLKNARPSADLQKPLEEARQRLDALYGDRLRRVILYGSQARGDATEESDVDVLVVLRDPIEDAYQEIKRTSELQATLLDRYELLFSFQHYAAADFIARRGPFMKNVHEEGIEL